MLYMDPLSLASLFAAVTITWGLPPNLINSICFIESSYNVSAVHHDDGNGDSLGVCQIKLETARTMGFPGTQQDLMYPPTNIYYSAQYLSHQIKRYHNDVNKAIIAYNQGSAKGLTRTKYSDKVLKQWRGRDGSR